MSVALKFGNKMLLPLDSLLGFGDMALDYIESCFLLHQAPACLPLSPGFLSNNGIVCHTGVAPLALHLLGIELPRALYVNAPSHECARIC